MAAWFLKRIVPVLCVVLVLGLHSARVSLADAVIYHRQDKSGVHHLTNRRGGHKGYRVYLVFRDILRHHPGLGKHKIIQLAQKHGKSYGIDPCLVQAVIEVESGYKADAVSSAGAEGLMQIMPDTQKDLGVRDSFDPDENVQAGVRYLKQMLDRFGSMHLALAAYNAGPGQVKRYNGVPPFPETEAYVKKVMSRYRRMKAGT